MTNNSKIAAALAALALGFLALWSDQGSDAGNEHALLAPVEAAAPAEGAPPARLDRPPATPLDAPGLEQPVKEAAEKPIQSPAAAAAGSRAGLGDPDAIARAFVATPAPMDLRPARTERKRFRREWKLEYDQSTPVSGGPPAQALQEELLRSLRIEFTETVSVLDEYEPEGLGARPPLTRRIEAASRVGVTKITPPEELNIAEDAGVSFEHTGTMTSVLLGHTLHYRWDPSRKDYSAMDIGRIEASSGSGKRTVEGEGWSLPEDLDLRRLEPPAGASVGTSWTLSIEDWAACLNQMEELGWQATGSSEEGRGGLDFHAPGSLLAALSSPRSGNCELSVEESGRDGSGLTRIRVTFDQEVRDSGESSAPDDRKVAALDFGTPSEPRESTLRYVVKGTVKGTGQLSWDTKMRRFERFEVDAQANLSLSQNLPLTQGLSPAKVTMPLAGRFTLRAECRSNPEPDPAPLTK